MSSADIAQHLRPRYRVRAPIGAGGMGQVVLVEDLQVGGVLRALKWVNSTPEISAEEKRHLREFRVLTRFHHPHILRVHDFGRVMPQVGQYFTADYMAGGSLAEAMRARRWELEPAVVLLTQVLRALEFLHENGWVHCDIKPANILLRDSLDKGPAECCLIDFGIAQLENHVPDKNVVGTVYYIPPERILGARLDRRGDLYAFGIMAFQLFSGRLPFPGENKTVVLEAHLAHEPPRLGDLRGDLPPALDELIQALLAKKPVDRPESALAVMDALRRLAGSPAEPETPATINAYLRHDDCCGWEDELQTVLGKVKQRVFGRDVGSWAGLADSLDPVTSRERHLLPLEPHIGGESKAGLVVVRGNSQRDLALFRDYIVRRIQMLGIAQVHLDARRLADPIEALLRSATGVAPADALRRKGLALADRVAAARDGRNPSPPSEALIEEIVAWFESLAKENAFTVLLEGFEGWGHSFFQLLSRLAASEGRRAGIKRLAWIGLQTGPAGLFAGQWLSSEQGQAWVERCAMRPLDAEALTRWLQLRFPGWDPADPMRNLLEEESEGSPSLLGHLLGSLVEEGLLRKGWEGWDYCEPPGGVNATALVRRAARSLDELGADRRGALEALEILGGSADAGWLIQSASDGAGVTHETIAWLDAHGWIEREEEGTRWRFRHVFQRKAVRRSIDAETWRAGNRRVAQRILQREREGTLVDQGRLASHLIEAGEPGLSLPYAARAAVVALEEGHMLTAIRWFERILAAESGTSPAQQVLALEELGDLRDSWGPPEEALDLRRRALELWTRAAGACGAPGASVKTLTLERKLALCEARAGRLDGAVERIRAALALPAGAEAASERRQMLLLLAEWKALQWQSSEAGACLDNLSQLPVTGHWTLRARECLLRVEHALALGRPGVAQELITSAIRRLDDGGAAAGAGWLVLLLGRQAQLSGRWLVAVHLYRLAASVFGRARETLPQARCLIEMGELCIAMQRAQEAEGYLERAEGLLRRLGAEPELGRLAFSRGQLYSRRGLYKEANPYLKRALAWGHRALASPWKWRVLLLQAEMHLRAGRLRECGELLAGAAHPKAAPHKHSPEPWCQWGRVAFTHALRLGEPARATGVLDEAMLQTRELGGLVAQLPLWMCRFEALRFLGCTADADRLRGQLDEWMKNHPDFRVAWAALLGGRRETELLMEGHEEDLSRYYLGRSRAARATSDRELEVFLLEEAKYHARRAGAVGLIAVASCHLAVAWKRTGRQAPDPESALRSNWKKLVATGAVEGRPEILSLWADHRREQGDLRGAEALSGAAARIFWRWSEAIPARHDLGALAHSLGLDAVPVQPALAAEVA